MNPILILDNIISQYKDILGDNLRGIYLHGSLAMGCYTNKSDIDFIVVIDEEIDHSVKRRLIDCILRLKEVPAKGIEMSILLRKDVKPFIYPTPFELHYSDYHRHKYLKDKSYVCHGDGDKDLAAHITVLKQRGQCLYGPSINEVFGEVPRKDYIDSIIEDILEAKEEILNNTVYIILNLCRVLYYLRENVVSSKKEGGIWGLEQLPVNYRSIINQALKEYTNEKKALFEDPDLLVEFVTYMLKAIENSQVRS